MCGLFVLQICQCSAPGPVADSKPVTTFAGRLQYCEHYSPEYSALCPAAGKLFPGPHLYAGAAIVVLWALAASLVPYMQKGNDTARSVHIAANTINLGLFAWQAHLRWLVCGMHGVCNEDASLHCMSGCFDAPVQ